MPVAAVVGGSAVSDSSNDVFRWSSLGYAVGGDVWVVRADGSGEPRRLIADAESPAVVHG